jgi:hypothetical protein
MGLKIQLQLIKKLIIPIVYHVINVQKLMMDHFHQMILIEKHFVENVIIHNEQNQQLLIMLQIQKLSMSF